jgi:hypothetical protein
MEVHLIQANSETGRCCETGRCINGLKHYLNRIFEKRAKIYPSPYPLQSINLWLGDGQGVDAAGMLEEFVGLLADGGKFSVMNWKVAGFL